MTKSSNDRISLLLGDFLDSLVKEGRITEQDIARIMKDPLPFVRRLEAAARCGAAPLDQPTLAALSYPRGFTFKPIEEQLAFWTRQLRFLRAPSQDWLENVTQQLLPKRAEGWVIFPDHTQLGKTYPEATFAMIDVLSERNSIEFGRTKTIGSKTRTQVNRKRFSERAQTQEHDFVLIPVQLGSGGIDFSSLKAIELLFSFEQRSVTEFILGLYELLAILATHDRLTSDNDLGLITADGALPNNESNNTLLTIQHKKGKLLCQYTLLPSPSHGFATGFLLKR